MILQWYHTHEAQRSCAFPPLSHVVSPPLILTPQKINSCDETKWELTTYTAVIALLAQLTIAVRSSHASQMETNSY